MRNVIAGTAGHIDHGKTSLVRALTGIDTDRLEEERRRGISIDLGFANLDLGDVRIGLVDVPGHERFVRNMLAGVGGIDLVLFVIAADESIKPQTREHFDICRLLQIPRGIVVLTKVDLVDTDIVELVQMEVEEFVKGSFLEGAPVVAVSATTGAGMDALKATIARVAGEIPLKDSSRRPRLPVDRAFSMKGFGTVVTGTLIAGAIALEQELEVYPTGKRVRVRGLQVHGAAAKRATAGQRTAVNLAGVDPGELARGMVLAEPGLFEPAARVDAVVDLLATAQPLKHGAPVHFHAGAAEVEAEVRLLDGAEPMKPGSQANVRFVLKDPLLMLPGDRFIVRMFSPVVTIAGGRVLDVAPPARMNRAESRERAGILTSASNEDRACLYVRESPNGLGGRDLIARTGWLDADIEALAKSQRLVVFRQPQLWFADKEWAAAKLSAIHETLKAFHRANPLLPGLSKEEIRSRELAGAPPFLLDGILGLARDLVADGETVRLASHKVTFQQDEELALGKIEAAFASAGLTVPATGEVLAASGVEPARAKSLLLILLKRQKLVRISDELVFHPVAIAGLRELLGQRKGVRFSVPEFKDWTGVSRKYAIPLLEFLDREHVTRRDGDGRVVL